MNSRSPRLMAVYAGLVSLAVLFAAAQLGTGVFDRLSAFVFDEYQRLKPRASVGAPVLIIDIDEASINEIGQWPWPRSQMAVLVDRLGELGAATVAFDMTFSEPDRTSLTRTLVDLRRAGAQVSFPQGAPELDNDTVFAQALERNSTVMGIALTQTFTTEMPKPKAGFAFGGRDPREILPEYTGSLDNLSILNQAGSGIGFFSFPPTIDGVVRKIPLVAKSGSALYPSLGMEALRVAQQARNFVVKSTGASGESEVGAPAIVNVRVGDFEVPTDGEGRLWVYYSGNLKSHTISALDLLFEPIDFARLAERVAGHIVFIGTSAVGLHDLVATPLGPSVPGVEVHGEIIDQILSGTFLHRPDLMPGVEYILAIVVTILLTLVLRPGSPVWGGALALTLFCMIVGLSWYLFASQQMLLDPLLPSLAVLVVFITVTVAQYLSSEHEKKFIRTAFGHYLAPSLVDRLSDDPHALKLGGELKELTLLFCDIRGFSSLSENLDPEHLTRLLNDFLTPMTDELLKSGATIDKYMGDAIMAFWNAPLDVPGHRNAAIQAALAMTDRLETLNAESGFDIKMGIGLNTGNCCVGNLGSTQRFNYSAIGDSVNVASRIEGITKTYGLQVLLADSVVDEELELPDRYIVLEVDLVRVVGRDEPLVLHTVLDRGALASIDVDKLLADHTKFLNAYRSGAFDVAADKAKQMMETGPAMLSRYYQAYQDRIAGFQAHPPTNWDGVYTFLSK